MKPINQVLFMGSKQLGLDCLNAMWAISPETLVGVITIDDSDDSRTVLQGFKDFCAKNDLALHIANSKSHSEELVSAIMPQLVIVVGWFWLISDRTLVLPSHGFLGIHNSILPKYRGGAPLVWAIMNDEPTLGISLFSFTEGMDDGDIWFQHETRLREDDDIGSVLSRLQKGAVEELKLHYNNILEGRIKPIPQDSSKATFGALRIPDDGLIDWRKTAREVYNFIRAQTTPYPGAFTFFKQEKLTVWKSKLNAYIYFGTPGQVIKSSPEGVEVVCGDNKTITILIAQLEGGDSVNANELIKSIKTRF